MCFQKTKEQKRVDTKKEENFLRSVDSYRSWYRNYSEQRISFTRRRSTSGQIEMFQPETIFRAHQPSTSSHFRRRSINVQPRPIQTFRPTASEHRNLDQMAFTRSVFQRMQLIVEMETMQVFMNPDSE